MMYIRYYQHIVNHIYKEADKENYYITNFQLILLETHDRYSKINMCLLAVLNTNNSTTRK
jgi:hypothetical protein